MALTNADITNELKKTLSPARFNHSLSVARLSARLARLHGWDAKKAYRAGLVHDVAKEWSPKELIGYYRRNKLKIPVLAFILKVNPNMLHAYVGAAEAKRRGWITDAVSLQAVASHTLGNLKMTVADKILYVADAAAPDRGFFKAHHVRAAALKDLQRGFAAAYELKVGYNLEKGKPVHPFSIEVWNRNVCRLVI